MKLCNHMNRRSLITSTALTGTGLIMSSNPIVSKTIAGRILSSRTEGKTMEPEVTATEDLMREHGVLRRILIIYSESALRIREAAPSIFYEQMNKAADLFRRFGENYHEKALEETYIFPTVKKSGGDASGYPDILVAQHSRGREITDYILAVTNSKRPAEKQRLANAMEAMVRMYRVHAATEDTIIFPAWKQTMSEEQLDEMGEEFEEIEHEQFGNDGFEKAVEQIAAIEKQLGLADLSQFTAPPLEMK